MGIVVVPASGRVKKKIIDLAGLEGIPKTL